MKYKCPECKKVTDKELWKETEVGCEDCGSHGALRCPECYEDIDMVFNDEKDWEVQV